MTRKEYHYRLAERGATARTSLFHQPLRGEEMSCLGTACAVKGLQSSWNFSRSSEDCIPFINSTLLQLTSFTSGNVSGGSLQPEKVNTVVVNNPT
jgi:hypothetical protein